MFYLRIDLGSHYGMGHYSRALSLIDYLNIKEYKIVVDNLKNNIFSQKEKKNFICLYDKKKYKNEIDDAKNFLSVIKEKKNTLTIVKDSYRFGFKWEKYVRKNCNKLVIIDDFPDKKHFADYYINHSPHFDNPKIDLINILKKNNKKKCQFLLGTKYALFNLKSGKKSIRSDIVFYNGGSGNILVYEKIINGIVKIKKNLRIILIVGPYAKNHRKVIKRFNSIKNIKIISKSSNILNYLRGTKLFVSSAGVSAFESSALKLPTLLFQMNFNQNLQDFDYEKLGHYFMLKKNDLIQTGKIVNLVLLMMKEISTIKNMMVNNSIKIENIKKNFRKYFK